MWEYVADPYVPSVIITPETPTGVLDYKTGDLILINCEATGLPTPSVEWSRDNGLPIGRSVSNPFIHAVS